MKLRTLLLGSSLSLALPACAAERAQTAPPQLTSAEVTEVTALYGETDAEHALHQGDLDLALSAAERKESTAPRDPRAHYDRAIALEEMGHVDSAAAEFRDAEARYAGVNTWAQSISAYGLAHLLASAGRCAEAKPAYERYATIVRGYAPNDAAMALALAEKCVDRPKSDPVEGEISAAVVAGEYERAIALARGRKSAWVDYNRAVALAALDKTDEAIVAFRNAEHEFATDQRRERALAIYGRARALTDAHRCTDAKRAYDEYVALVRSTSPADADMAATYAASCH